MSVIEASSVGVKTMADGTLRITLDIEPRHSKDAFNLFGAPGTPCALAALVAHRLAPNPVVAQESEEVSDKPKGGALAKLAGMWCNDDDFCDWLATYQDRTWDEAARGMEFLNPSEIAAHTIRLLCEIESRAELDNDAIAAERFQAFVRGPYMKHQLARGVTA